MQQILNMTIISKEQAKLEQAAIREQMSRKPQNEKELEKRKAQIEAGESKYVSEIEKVGSPCDWC